MRIELYNNNESPVFPFSRTPFKFPPPSLSLSRIPELFVQSLHSSPEPNSESRGRF